MKKAATLTVTTLAAIFLSLCSKEEPPSKPTRFITYHFRYGDLISVLEDPAGQDDTYRDAARFYCFTDSDHRMTIYTSLNIDAAYFEPLSMADQVLRWSITPYQGPQAHYQSDQVIQVWFLDTITRANFDFTFQLRFKRRSP